VIEPARDPADRYLWSTPKSAAFFGGLIVLALAAAALLRGVVG
jgi:hypothetical protein